MLVGFNTTGLIFCRVIKSLVYTDNPDTIDVLEKNIRRVSVTAIIAAKSGRKLSLSVWFI